jgi:hypothetical protein
MSTSPQPSNVTEARAQRVTVTADTLVVDLVDGRTISVPAAASVGSINQATNRRGSIAIR